MKKNIFRSLFSDLADDTEDRTKFIQRRIQIVQKYIPLVNSAISDYVNKSVGLTGSGDKIASSLENYSRGETVTTVMKQQLQDFANILCDVSSRRNQLTETMESDVLQELREYGKLCKNVQVELKACLNAYDRERMRLRQLRRAQSDHLDDRQQISIAESEYMRAKTESSRCAKSLEEQIDIFERRRLSGLRNILLSWTIAELRYHAKALESFTEAYNVAAKINVEADMEEFRNKLRAENTPRLDSSRETSFQRSDSLMQLLSMPFHRSERLTGVGIPHPSPSRMSSANRVLKQPLHSHFENPGKEQT